METSNSYIENTRRIDDIEESIHKSLLSDDNINRDKFCDKLLIWSFVLCFFFSSAFIIVMFALKIN